MVFNNSLSIIIGDSSTHLFQSNTYARSEFLHVPSGTNRREGVIRLLAGSNFTLLRPFVDILGMKLDELRGPDFTMRCFCNSVYTLRGADWCSLLFRASNRISMSAYTMVIGQTSTWICVLHHSLCLTDEFQRRTKPVLDWVSVCRYIMSLNDCH